MSVTCLLCAEIAKAEISFLLCKPRGPVTQDFYLQWTNWEQGKEKIVFNPQERWKIIGINKKILKLISEDQKW